MSRKKMVVVMKIVYGIKSLADLPIVFSLSPLPTIYTIMESNKKTNRKTSVFNIFLFRKSCKAKQKPIKEMTI